MEKKSTRERKKIGQLARQYTAKGFTVYCDIRGYLSPDLINGVMPDLVAVGEGKTIITEVATREELREQVDQMMVLADYAGNNARLRFDLVVNNPSENYHVVPSGREWAIRGNGKMKRIAVVRTKAEAVSKARKMARSHGLMLIIHGADGKIQQRDSYRRRLSA